MPRKGPAPRRELVADPIYRSVQVTQLINKVMLHGKRSVAETIVYDAMKVVETKTGEGPLDTVKRAIDNVKPPLEVKSRRVGGATYQVPVEVRPRRATTLSLPSGTRCRRRWRMRPGSTGPGPRWPRESTATGSSGRFSSLRACSIPTSFSSLPPDPATISCGT